jgi:hypothetical protein
VQAQCRFKSGYTIDHRVDTLSCSDDGRNNRVVNFEVMKEFPRITIQSPPQRQFSYFMFRLLVVVRGIDLE